MLDLTASALLLAGAVTAAGAALGAFIAHCSRGPRHLPIGRSSATSRPSSSPSSRRSMPAALGILALAVLVVCGWVFG